MSTIEVNTLSGIAMMKAVLPSLKNKKQSMIVNVLSVAGLVGAPLRTIYSTSKAALSGFG